MADVKIQALENDAPFARQPRGLAVRRKALFDAEGWNAMACAAPLRREVMENAPPGSITARGVVGRGYADS